MFRNWSTVAFWLDRMMVALSILLSLLFFDGRVMGTREGTIISALCVGMTVKFFRKRLQQPLTKLLTK